MIFLLVLFFFIFAFFSTHIRGPAFAFNRIFIPVFLLIPFPIFLELPAIPDLNIRRAILLSIWIAALMQGKGVLRKRSVSRVDKLVLISAIAWSISYAKNTDLMGFVHQLSVQLLDFYLPYYFVRTLWIDKPTFLKALTPLALSTLILSILAIYESRMISRGYAEFWQWLVGTGVMPYFEQFRSGYLRAAVVFDHPITLGVAIATIAPLILLWGSESTKWRRVSKYGVFASIMGTIATLSRGPIIAVFLGLICVRLLKIRRKYIYRLLAVICVITTPYVLGWLASAIAYINQSLEVSGNVSSGYYRIALFMIYLDDIIAGGLLGNPLLVGKDFSLAWSIDNSFIYMFMIYGWLGGGVFVSLVVTLIRMAIRNVRITVGRERHYQACICSSVFALCFAMVNVWPSFDYAPLLIILLGLVVNQSKRIAGKSSNKAVNQNSRRPYKAFINSR